MAKAPQTTAKAEDWDTADEAPAKAGSVKVKCIVHTLPHTGLALEGAAGLGMQFKEVREVPEDVALLMQDRGQVEIL